jgi:hypothetical protein
VLKKTLGKTIDVDAISYSFESQEKPKKNYKSQVYNNFKEERFVSEGSEIEYILQTDEYYPKNLKYIETSENAFIGVEGIKDQFLLDTSAIKYISLEKKL